MNDSFLKLFTIIHSFYFLYWSQIFICSDKHSKNHNRDSQVPSQL